MTDQKADRGLEADMTEAEMIENDILAYNELEDAERYYPRRKPSLRALLAELHRRCRQRGYE